MKTIKSFGSKVIKWTATLGVVGLLGYMGYLILQEKVGTEKYEANATSTMQVSTTSTDSELEAIINDPGFQAAMKLKARKIQVEREKAVEVAKHEELVASEKMRNEAEVARIEAELEQIRKEELQLGDANL